MPVLREQAPGFKFKWYVGATDNCAAIITVCYLTVPRVGRFYLKSILFEAVHYMVFVLAYADGE